MTDFMTHKHIINNLTCPLPHRQGQYPTMDVEGGSLNLFVLHYKVLSGKELGKLRFDFVGDHTFVSYRPIIQKKEGSNPPDRHFLNWIHFSKFTQIR